MAKPNNVLNVTASDPSKRGRAIAGALLRPSVNAARTLSAIEPGLNTDVPLTDLVDELSDQAKIANRGDLARPEAMLVAQAHTLDALFANLVQRAVLNMGQHLPAADTYLRLALRAQAQARATIETLAEIKNPRAFAIVGQANIANGPQQINNHSPGNVPQPRAGETPDAPNELIAGDQSHEQHQVDAGAARFAGTEDPAVVPVASRNRSEDA